MMDTFSLSFGPVPDMAEPPSADRTPQAPTGDVRLEAETSFNLVCRAHEGDEAARNELCARYLPRMQRWAHGRLPKSARGSLDTVDLVQDTFIRALQRLDHFEPHHPGAFQAYLRRTLMNIIVDVHRAVQRRGTAEPIDPASPASGPSPLEEAIGQETLERYERALSRLRDGDRLAVIMRIELDCSYQEIMDTLDKPSVAAAHMAVSRALVRLAEEMSCDRA